MQGHRPVTADATIHLAVGGTTVVGTDRATLAEPYESAIPEAIA